MQRSFCSVVVDFTVIIWNDPHRGTESRKQNHCGFGSTSPADLFLGLFLEMYYFLLLMILQVVNVLNVAELDGKIRLKYVLSMDWIDTRLSFLNLRGLRALNTLNEDEFGAVWRPEVYYDNVELDRFEVNVSPGISVVTNSSYQAHLVTLSDLYNAQEFEGASNALRWSTKAR